MQSLGGSIQYTNSSFWRPNMVIKEIVDDKMLYMDLSSHEMSEKMKK